MKINLLFTILIIIISVIEISAALSGQTLLVYIFKPAILLSLVGWTLICWNGPSSKRKMLFMTGLVFALLGDILLMIRGADLFIPGLGSFLIMQVLYIFTFRIDVRSSLKNTGFMQAAIPFLLFAVVLYAILFPKLPDAVMRIAVAIYAISIAFMAWMAWLRKGFVSTKSFAYVFLGAVLFMISDSLIALDRFLLPIPFNTIWVMGTYSAAQYLIVMGILKKQAGFSNQPA